MVVTTVVTTTTISQGTAAAFGAIAVVLLIGLLIAKELAGASTHPVVQRFSRVVNVAAIPLLLTFAAIFVAKVTAVIH